MSSNETDYIHSARYLSYMSCSFFEEKKKRKAAKTNKSFI